MAGNDRGGRLTRRQFIQGAAAAAASSAVGTRAANAARPTELPPGHSDADINFVNGKIHTMDAQNSIVSSLSIKDGRFLSVGDTHPGPRTQVIDLRGRTVVPGIIDNHNHIVLMGNRPGYHTPLENAYSIDDVKAIYAARAAGIPRDAWITTIGGFHSNHIYANPADPLSGRLPTRQELDAAVPNNPVFIEIGFTGPATTNSAGKSIFEGQGITVAENGSMTGNNPSRALLYLRQTLLNPESRRRSVIDAMKYAATVGVTTHLDQGAFQATNTIADGAAHCALQRSGRRRGRDPGLRSCEYGGTRNRARDALGGGARAGHHAGVDRPAAGNRRQPVAYRLAVPRGESHRQHRRAVRRAAVPHDRRQQQPAQRHPRRHELRRHADRADEPVAAHVLRDHRPERQEGSHQPEPADHAPGGAQPVHAPERLVPARGRPARLDRGRQARRPGGAQQRLLCGLERRSEEDPLGADRGGRQHRLRRRCRRSRSVVW